MKTNTPDTLLFSWLPLAVYVLAASLLASCGDLSTTGTSAESGSGMIISGVGVGGTGVVKSSAPLPGIDTGLVGAVVFLDTNNNRLPDQGEPAAVTDQEGGYTLPLDPVQVTAYPLLLQALAGQTVVKATGQTVTSDFVIELQAAQ